MNQGFNYTYLSVAILLLPIMWIISINILRKMARLTKSVSIDTDEKPHLSKWGSGNINGVGFKGSLRVARYRHGYLLETMKLFGGGKLWLAKDEIRVEARLAANLLRPRRLKISCGDNEIVLYGYLVDEIDGAE